MAKDAKTPTCGMNFCNCRRDLSVEKDSAAKSPSTTSAAVVPNKFDVVVTWLLGGVTSAFFASLERCSCINVATEDDVGYDGSSPLIHSDVTDIRREEEVDDNKDAIRTCSERAALVK